ncbi:MAG: hypothetical protein ACXWNZ_16855 [Vulcanimicrobiaceae bacterium]
MQHLLDPASIAAYATVILAIFTAWMAAETRRLAGEGRDAAQWTDYQHQEALTPILKIDEGGVRYAGHARYTFMINTEIINRGSGPATEVSFTFILPNGESKTWEVPPLGVGDSYHVEGEVSWHYPDPAHPFTPWQVHINYKNLFEAPAYTKYIEGHPRTFYSRPPRINRLQRKKREPFTARFQRALGARVGWLSPKNRNR